MKLLQWIPSTPPVTRQRFPDTPGEGENEGENNDVFYQLHKMFYESLGRVNPFATWSELKGVEVGHDIEVRGRIVGTDREDS